MAGSPSRPNAILGALALPSRGIEDVIDVAQVHTLGAIPAEILCVHEYLQSSWHVGFYSNGCFVKVDEKRGNAARST